MNATLLKLGGELLESDQKLSAVGRAMARASGSGSLVVVHGGGRQIDRALGQAGIQKRQVDGLRVTDAQTLDIVVSVLAGAINTKLVAALNAGGARAVGLTGADAGVAPLKKAPAHRTTSGDLVDLGLVGEPMAAPAPRVVVALCALGVVPAIACIGASRRGQLFNVNADTLAASLAARLRVRRLVVAGGTAGVLDERGQTIPRLEPRDIRALVASGTASAGMVAKLAACQAAARAGVAQVVIVDGRNPAALGRAIAGGAAGIAALAGTRITV